MGPTCSAGLPILLSPQRCVLVTGSFSKPEPCDSPDLGCACPSLGEPSAIKEEDLVVWVDPLDGTKEYTEGLLDTVTVLIGIAYEGKAIAGIINQPYYNYQVLLPTTRLLDT